MNGTPRISKSLVAFLSLLVAAGVHAAPGLPSPDLGGLEPPRASIESVRLDPEQQAAGGTVLVRIGFRVASGFKIAPDSIKLSLDAAPPALSGIKQGTVFIRDAEGQIVPSDREYVRGGFTANLPLELPAGVPPGTYALGVRIQYAVCQEQPFICFLPERAIRPASLTVRQGEAVGVALPVFAESDGEATQAPSDYGEGDAFAEVESLWLALAVAFGLGFLLILTPCVYPLIPVTVAVIGAAAERRRLGGLLRSFVYVLGITVTYSLAGVIAARTGEAFSAVVRHPAVTFVLVGIFLAMACAMFDVFTIDLSSQRLQRLQARLRGKGGLLGLFAVGMLAGAGVTACIAPVIVAALGYVARIGNPVLGFLIFFAMAWGFGLPLVVLGTFAGLAKSLPKAGDWMNVIKRVIGMALVAVALYYIEQSGVLGDMRWLGLLCLLVAVLGLSVLAWDAFRQGESRGERLRQLVTAVFALAAVGLIYRGPMTMQTSGPAAERVSWLELTAGQEDTIDPAGRPVLLKYWTEDCKACKKMLRTTFRDPRVVAESKRFVFAKVDMTQAQADGGSAEWRHFVARYRVQGVPVIVLRGADGEQKRKLIGEVNADKLLEALGAVR